MDTRPDSVLDHLAAMTDDTGLIQHATHDVPNRSTGYCTDDIARALMVAVCASRRDATASVARRLVTVYLAFLHDAQLPDGWFHNFMGYDRSWQDRRGTEDSFGRAVWGLCHCLRFAPRSSWRALSGRLVTAALPRVRELEHLRPRAYVALGLVHALRAAPFAPEPAEARSLLTELLRALWAAFERDSGPGWTWCEPVMTYDNARLCEALVRGGEALADVRAIRLGLRMLDFYADTVIEDGRFVPVGTAGWLARGATKARYGEQPIEAAAMIDAALAAYEVSGESRYRRYAEIAYAWFFGANSAGAVMVADGGGCCDGIDAQGVNPNMGAESTLAYALSALAFATPAAARLHIVR